MKKEISKKEAKEKYGIIIKRFHAYKYYLLDNGDVVDSDGDIRYQPLKNLIKKSILKLDPELDETLPIEDNQEIENYTYKLEEDGLIDFSILERTSQSGDDYWLQAEYYSNKIEKVVIFDYSYSTSFENLDDFAQCLSDTDEQIKEFENKITFNK